MANQPFEPNELTVWGISLGDEVKDIITGFTGICGGIAQYRYSLPEVRIDERKEQGNNHWFPIGRVEVVKSRSLGFQQMRKERYGTSGE